MTSRPMTNRELSIALDAEILADRARRNMPNPRVNPLVGPCADCGTPLVKPGHPIPAGHMRLVGADRCSAHYKTYKETP